jgi:hypothetical protein
MLETAHNHDDRALPPGRGAIAALLTLGAIVAAALALAAPAMAAGLPGGFEKARFKVEVEGSSNTTWHRAYEPEDDCAVSDHSFGRERYTFKSTKPIFVTALRVPGQLNPTLYATNARTGIPTRVRVQRSYTPVLGPGPAAHCLGTGGGGDPTRPDCGTKVFKPWMLSFEFSQQKKGWLQLRSDDANIALPYESCPGGLFGFPTLLDKQGQGKRREPLYAQLSADDLFDPEFRKWITVGDGERRDTSETWWTKTDVHWALSFTRLGGKH